MSQDQEAMGLLAVLKPPGPTSHDVVGRLRRILGTRRVGHAGTLDPAASGVLVMAYGKATRLLGHVRDDKRYLAEVAFGLATDAGDAEGALEAQADASSLRAEALLAALPALQGRITQRPPRRSAVHIGGQRAHALMRAGQLSEADMPERDVLIHEAKLEGFASGPLAFARLRLHCGTGTYVRSFAVDWGRAVGLPACLSFLLREAVGAVALGRAQSVEELATEGPRPLAWHEALGHLPQHRLNEGQLKAWGHGQSLPGDGRWEEGATVWVEGPDGAPLGLGLALAGRLKPEVVL